MLIGKRRSGGQSTLLSERSGAGALEFAIIGLPFLTFLIFLVELGYDFFAQIALDYGVQTAARQIQIGAAQGASTAAAFRSDYLCPALDGLLPCASVSVNVFPVTSDYYTAVPSTVPKNNHGQLDTTGFTYCPGKPKQLMFVQAAYTSPSLVATFVPSMAIGGPGSFVHLTLSSTGFINEDYPVTSGSPAGCL